jgi:hypothetical protein
MPGFLFFCPQDQAAHETARQFRLCISWFRVRHAKLHSFPVPEFPDAPDFTYLFTPISNKFSDRGYHSIQRNLEGETEFREKRQGA